MILSIIIVTGITILSGITILALLLNIAADRRENYNKANKISFKESMDLVELPIVTFINNGKKLNFLLDTGASYSSINEGALEGLAYQETGEIGSHFGIEGVYKEARYIKMGVTYKDQSYEGEFQVLDLSVAFGNIKQDFGINLHGILGSTFFQKYKYILDFDQLIAYSMI